MSIVKPASELPTEGQLIYFEAKYFNRHTCKTDVFVHPGSFEKGQYHYCGHSPIAPPCDIPMEDVVRWCDMKTYGKHQRAIGEIRVTMELADTFVEGEQQ